MALGLGASVGWSQPVPDTILLPDSLGPLRPGYHLAFGSSTNNIYVASESSDIIVVDGNSFQRIKRINTGTPVGGALLVSQHNKLYCSYPQQGRIGVIDCATNTVIGSIQVGSCPTLLCYSSGADKLYCGDSIDRTVSVINCTTNTVLKVIPVGASPTMLGYEPTTDKVYAGTGAALLAISCSMDSVVATIPSIKGARGMCVNKRHQKVYVARSDSSWIVRVVSAVSDSVVAEIVTVPPFPGMVCNEATDRLYVADRDGHVIEEFDCAGDTLTDYYWLGDSYYETRGLIIDSVHNRLYYLYEMDGSWLLTLDCADMQFVAVVRVHDYAAILAADPARYRVLCAGGQWESVLTVFDYKGDSLYARGGAPLCGWQLKLWRNTADDKLYFRWGSNLGGIGVIDEQAKRVSKLLFLPQAAEDTLVYCRTYDKAYFLATKGLGVLDGARESLLKVIEIGDGHVIPCYCPDENKVYCTYYGPHRYIAAIDCSSDSVLWKRDDYAPVGMQYLGNHRLLCWEEERLFLLDTRTDSILVDTAVGAGLFVFAHTGDGKKVYIVHGTRIEVLDGSSLDLLATVDWAYDRAVDPFLMCADSAGKIYWFVRDQYPVGPDSILAIDTQSDTVVARLGVGYMQAQGCLDHSGRYIFNPNPENDYYPNPDPNNVIIYDTQCDTVAAMYRDLPAPVSATPNSERHRIYVGCQDVILVYPDVPPGVQETPNAKVRTTRSGPTVVKGVLVLGAAGSRQNAEYRAGLMDISGRKVLDLHAGANDVRGLAPGVYFVRQAPSVKHEASSVTKVVLTE